MPSRNDVAFAALSAILAGAIALSSLTSVQAQSLYRRNPAARPPADKILHLTFTLKVPQQARLNASIAGLYSPDSPTYHRWLTPQQFGQQFGADDRSLNTVCTFASTYGLHIDRIWSNHLFVSCSAPVSQVEHAFQIRIEGYDRSASEVAAGKPSAFFAPSSQPHLPAALASCLTGVFGLSNYLVLRPAASTFVEIPAPLFGIPSVLSPASGGPPSFAPSELSTLYNLDPLHAAGFTGQGQAVAIYATSTFYLTDIEAFAEAFGLSATNVHAVPIDGGASDSGEATEVALDVETVLGQTPDAQIFVYEGSNDGSATLDLFNQIAQDNIPVLINSFGVGEVDLTRDDENAFEPIFQQMAMQGQSHFEATGDNGAYGDPSFTTRSVNYPAASIYATAVGGTVIPSTANGLWRSETASPASGGGLSVFLRRPTWQSGPGVANAFSTGLRQVPDVAADTSSPGFEIYARGAWRAGGSTGGSTSLWAAADLLIAQALGHRTGLLNPDLYRIGTTLNDPYAPFVFHDIKVGNNTTSVGVGYAATPFWDYVTGWGSADFAKLFADLGLTPKVRPYTPGEQGPGGTWSSPIVIHARASSAQEPTVFSENISYAIGCAIANDGPADAIATPHSLTVDTTATRFDLGPIAAGSRYYRATLQATTVKFAPGFHTLTLKADADGQLPGSKKTPNVFTREIVVPTDGVNLTSLAASPDYLTGGQNTTGTVTIATAAPKGGVVIALLTNNPHVALPQGLTLRAGATSGTFLIRTFPVLSNTTVTISATSGRILKNASIQLTPPSLAGLIIDGMQGRKVQLSSGTTTPALVTLTGAAPAGGAQIHITSTSSILSVPSSVTIAAGQTLARFAVTAAKATKPQYATLKAVYGQSIVTVLVTIVP